MMSAPPVRPIQVQYFAVLREQRGLSDEVLHTAARTPRHLYSELQQKAGLALPAAAMMVAVNDQFAGWDVALESGDRVAFIPPVAGG